MSGVNNNENSLKIALACKFHVIARACGRVHDHTEYLPLHYILYVVQNTSERTGNAMKLVTWPICWPNPPKFSIFQQIAMRCNFALIPALVSGE